MLQLRMVEFRVPPLRGTGQRSRAFSTSCTIVEASCAAAHLLVRDQLRRVFKIGLNGLSSYVTLETTSFERLSWEIATLKMDAQLDFYS